MPHWVLQLPPAPQVGWHCVRDPPHLRRRGESVRTHMMTDTQVFMGHHRHVESLKLSIYKTSRTLVMFLSWCLNGLLELWDVGLFTYVFNGGHQQQDNGGNVQDDDSSQNQHCGFRGNWSKRKKTRHFLMSMHWYVTQGHINRHAHG